MTLGYKATAQTKQDFDAKLQNHIQTFFMDNQEVDKWKKENTAPFIKLDPTENEDMLNKLVTELKHKYIIANMDDYKRAYFPEEFVAGMMMTDTFICDNGGFESDFLYYKGYRTVFEEGSTTCTPLDGGNPVIYIQTTLPTTRQFEIVTSGTDTITGLQKVKFGSKALKVNDPFNHNLGGRKCFGALGINKITKRFKVTEENRDFTVWYSLALENPAGHNNTQPFFNIKCDLAPISELCFDAEILDCDSNYTQPDCGSNNLMDVLDWSCHRIKIPADEVGNIATLEIVVGDCGEGQHNGYAYIDGICEECTGSALGSIDVDSVNYFSCSGDIAHLCGSLSLPTVCGTWVIDSIVIPGYPNLDYEFDTISGTYCIDFPYEYFGFEDCLDVYVLVYFSNGTGQLPPQSSNDFEICKENFEAYGISVIVGECQTANSDNNISNDYYYVRVNLVNTNGRSWSIDRQLDEPYPGESGRYTILSGSGDQSLILGPFLIQEGGWILIIDLPGCTYFEPIEPPSFCSTCTAFNKFKITRVLCDGDDWYFNFIVEKNPETGDFFRLNGVPKDFNEVESSISFEISDGCKEFTLTFYDAGGEVCSAKFTVCPPNCNEECELEVYTIGYDCQKNEDDYFVYLNVKWSEVGILCYQVYNAVGTTGNAQSITSFPSGGIVGSFDDDVYIKVVVCNEISCDLCTEPDCFKWIYVPKPDCEEPEFGLKSNNKNIIQSREVFVVPNPINEHEIIIKSMMPSTSFELFNSSGQILYESSFKGSEYKFSIQMTSGIYFIKYIDSHGRSSFIKLLKI